MGIMGAAGIAAIAGIGSSLIGSSSASDAANAQVQAANSANQTELSMFGQTQSNLQPFMGAGTNALAALMNGMGLASPTASAGGGGANPNAQWDAYLSQYPDVSAEAQRQVGMGAFPNADAYAQWHYQHYGRNDGHNLPQIQSTAPAQASSSASPGFGSLVAPFTQAQFQASPGYQYQLDQSTQAINNSAAARGGLVSGNALKALQANATGLANQDWYNAQNSYYQQQQQKFNMLQTLAGSGQNAAAHLGSLGSQVAGSIGANTIGAGNAASAGIVAQGQSFSNLLNNQSFLQGISSLFGSGGGASYDPSAMYAPMSLDTIGTAPATLGYDPSSLMFNGIIG